MMRRKVARSGSPATPTVGKVESRSAALRPKFARSSSGAALTAPPAGAEASGVLSGSRCAKRWPRTRYAFTSWETRPATPAAVMSSSFSAAPCGIKLARARGAYERGAPLPLPFAFAIAAGGIEPFVPFWPGADGGAGGAMEGARAGPSRIVEERAPRLVDRQGALAPASVQLLHVSRVDAEFVEHGGHFGPPTLSLFAARSTAPRRSGGQCGLAGLAGLAALALGAALAFGAA